MNRETRHPFPHPATALSVITAGGTPVFVDVDLESRNMTAEILSEAITDRTKAIQPVSIFGNPVDIDPPSEVSLTSHPMSSPKEVPSP